jgi:Acetokinase family
MTGVLPTTAMVPLCREWLVPSVSQSAGGNGAHRRSEHASEIRGRICARCAWLGVILDERANSNGEVRITSEASAVRVYVVPTDEERMIAEHTVKHIG